MTEEDAYRKLIALLDRSGARYRLLNHPPEGRTEIVSGMRGNHPKDAAKCIIAVVKLRRKATKYILAVLPGNRRLDLVAVKTLFEGTYVSFASAVVAERLAGSGVGTILPFAFNSELELIADPTLRDSGELFFNAGRLDVSVALKTEDYFAIARPRIESIAQDPIDWHQEGGQPM